MKRLGSIRKGCHRLEGLYGLVYEVRSRDLLRRVIPPAIDLGTGLGTWIPTANSSGVWMMGVELDWASLSAGSKHAPGPRVQATAHRIPVGKKRCRTMVFREAAHHFDMPRILEEARRLEIDRLVFYEPNPGPLLRLCHFAVGHKDEVLSMELAESHLTRAGFHVVEATYTDLFALPLSGGWIAFWSLPRMGWIGRALITLDEWLVVRFPKALRKWVCFRWIIVAEAGTEDAHRRGRCDGVEAVMTAG